MTTEELMRKHFDHHQINYEDIMYPMQIDCTWQQMRDAINDIIQDIKDHKEKFQFPDDLGNTLKTDL